MGLLCLNKKCSYNKNCKCQMVVHYVKCMGFDDENAKRIINRELNRKEDIK